MQKLVAEKFASYPDEQAQALLSIRALVFELAEQLALSDLEESLKWGQPSYTTKKGSTIRLGCTIKTAQAQLKPSYSVFFNCNSLLIETFRELYPQTFSFIGNREIIFTTDQELPIRELKHCLRLALRYHQLKHLPLLGACISDA